ncbi:hypothetical protein T459_11523 [Capsicum annuum]|uniref:Endonuclease/exonuclease/phosphatase domain-containing protein n=1 Tax=Capsicum annuum TaxID=4072 RepID=A0A2G2ZM55_CAPAN|nr:hypothetical protein FXO37_36149 [Capsicum annuum]PHT83080.1 hypothetical protein T459_11523 [Capsicum annuum]
MLQGKGGYGSLWNADRIDFEIHGKVELNNEKIMFTAIYGIKGSPVTDNEIKDFAQFLGDHKLTELWSVGRRYTWTNGHVFSKLDRAIVNAEWVQRFPNVEAIVMDPRCSDHSPIGIEVDSSKPPGKMAFKFFNVLAEHPSFPEIIRQALLKPVTGVTMRKVWEKVKLAKQELKGLNNREFTGMDRKIQEAREKLEEIQVDMRCNMSPELFEEKAD